MLCRDFMLLHEVADLQVYFIDFPCFISLSPWGAFSSLQGPSFPSRVSLVFGRVASLFVADETLVVPHVFHSFTRREVDLVYVHGVRVPRRSSSSSCLCYVFSLASLEPLYFFHIDSSSLTPWFIIILLSYSSCFTLTHPPLPHDLSSSFFLTHHISHWLTLADSWLIPVIYINLSTYLVFPKLDLLDIQASPFSQNS